MRNVFLFILLAWLTGCSLFPKKVEYFQDKVEKMPDTTLVHKETQKEAAAYIAKKTGQTVNAAIQEDSSTNVLKPALDANLVAESLSGSLGKPLNPSDERAEKLAAKLDKLDAKLDRKLESFRHDNDENAGKKIEGTGLIQIGYFTQFIILAVILCAVMIAIKIIGLFNPAVAVGSQVLSGGLRGVSKIVSSGFSQVISAGEAFKKRIDEEIEDPATKEKILDLFKRSHLEKQSPEVQEVIKKLTNPDVK